MKNDGLSEMLKVISLHALLICVSKGLTRQGFGDVEILDRRETRQKTRYGGHEILCQWAAPTA